ncbi:MAG: MFS transporter [Leptospira sp.]|nr:MFS transporter [Leptospira sp.]
MNRIIFLSVPFLVNILLATFTEYWGYYDNKTYVILGSSLVILSLILSRKQDNYLNQFLNFINNTSLINFLPYFYAFILILFIIYPIRNLNYGDGIILLENSYLEGSLFGFQITLDEFLEGFLHSFLINRFQSSFEIYRWFSTFAGFLFLTLCIYIIYKEKRTNIEGLLLIATGSILLFFGYAENYTLVSLFILGFIYILYKWMKDQKEDSSIYWIAMLAALGALFHLVFGYLAFSLAYYTYIKSKKRSFLVNTIISILMAGSLIGLVFIYFLFFSDPIASTTQTHVMSQPFYPLRKIISTRHFLDILGNLWFTSSFALIFISMAYYLDKLKFKLFCSHQEIKIILLAIFGFLLHSIIFNPVLNYPADWDLMSFYSLPLIFLCFLYYPQIPNKNLLLPIILYFIGFYISTAITLSKNPIDLEHTYREDMKIAEIYVKENITKYNSINRYKKKDYLKLDYFLFKSQSKLEYINHKEKRELLKENLSYKSELDTNLKEPTERFNKEWIKKYYIKLTDYHYRYLKALEEDKKYRLGTL